MILLAILQEGLAGTIPGHTPEPSTTNHHSAPGWPRFYLAVIPKADPSNDGTAISRAISTPSHDNGVASPEAVPFNSPQYDVQAKGYGTSGAIPSILPSSV